MKKGITNFIMIIVFIISPLFLNLNLQAQTAGNMTFNFTTASSSGYSPKHCIAVWIENNSGTFIKTKLKMCSSSNLDHLTNWTGKSGSNVVDATSGSTRTTNGALSVVWNGTDVSGNIVTNGVYKVWVEYAWGSSNTTGKLLQSFTFTKGATLDHQTPADYTSGTTGSLTAMTIDWSPAVGIDKNSLTDMFSVYPNPVTNQSVIKYTLKELSDVTICLFDISGKLVKVLTDDNQNAGSYSLPLSMNGEVTPGVYFLKMNTGKAEHTSKIFILE
ncbi:MAG: DUF2271 domain-containing protein [Bacteroidales bacterium]